MNDILSSADKMSKKQAIQDNGIVGYLHVVNHYRDGTYKLPFFQREPLMWPLDQRQSFVRRLCEGPAPTGVIVVYQVEDTEDNDWYILEGLQRLSTLQELRDAPELYEVGDTEQIPKWLDLNTIPLQRRTYRTHMEAHVEFVLMHPHLPLPAYEPSQAG